MSRIFENNIYNLYIDPLTGFQNFFKLIESDMIKLFCEGGSIILFDIAGFLLINENYGREFGDVCLKTLSDSIRNGVSQYENASTFRTDGDEFTIVLPNLSYEEAEKVANLIKSDFQNNINKHNVAEVNIHTFILKYSEKITSISEFYKMVFKASFNMNDNDENSFEKRWIDQIIENLMRRINETLLFYNDAYKLALTDDISGLSNQRAAKLYLSKLMEDIKANNQEFSLLFIDGDNLKRYNKVSYQHGNEMIKELSTVIINSMRKSDRVYRWLSGDEFLVILENTNEVNAFKLAERIRASVENESENWVYPVTISIGLASFPKDGSTVEQIINKAEKANSVAKSLGKNQVVKWDKSM